MKHGVLLLLLLLAPLESVWAKLQVFACEPEWAALVDELGGEQVESVSATHANQDPHRIQAKPSLIAKLRRADLLICSGAGLEQGWLPLLQRKAANPKVLNGKPGFLEAAMAVERIGKPALLDRSLGDLHAEGNPHVHLDPERLLTVAGVVKQRLQQLAPDQADFFAQRYAEFERRWRAAMTTWRQRAEPLQGKGVVTYHQDLNYLLLWLGMRPLGVVESKPGIPPSARQLSELKSQLSGETVSLILRTPFQDERPVAWLAEQLRVPALVLPFSVGEQAADLFALFDRQIELLRQRVVESVHD